MSSSGGASAGGGGDVSAQIAAALALLPDAASMLAVGLWHTTPIGQAGATAMAEGIERALPFQVGRACTIDQLGINVTVAGAAGAVIRLGIRDDANDGTDFPGALLVDADVIDATTTGAKPKALAVPLVVAAGVRLWLTATCQGAAVTRPTVNIATGVTPLGGIGEASLSTLLGNTLAGAQSTGSTPGALPATQAWTHTTSPFRVAARTSA